MKKVRMIVSAAIVFAVVGSALAFKPLGAGTVYCSINGQGVCQSKVDFQKNDNGTVTAPCGSGVQPYTIESGVCTATSSSQKFSATLP